MCVQVRNNLFEPVLAAFLANGERYNLLNSAVLEMVEFIRKENIKPLVIHLVEQYGQRLASCTYVDTFRNLKLKFEQNQVISLASVYRSTHDNRAQKICLVGGAVISHLCEYYGIWRAAPVFWEVPLSIHFSYSAMVR